MLRDHHTGILNLLYVEPLLTGSNASSLVSRICVVYFPFPPLLSSPPIPSSCGSRLSPPSPVLGNQTATQPCFPFQAFLPLLPFSGDPTSNSPHRAASEFIAPFLFLFSDAFCGSKEVSPAVFVSFSPPSHLNHIPIFFGSRSRRPSSPCRKLLGK